MIASKVVCDDTYSNKSWCIVGQSLYTLKEVNQMEREMCSYLEWILHVEAAELESFTQRVKKEYGAECPAIPPQWVSSSVVVPQAVASSSTAAVMPAATSLVSPTEASRSQVVVPAQSYPSPRSSPPSPSHSSDSSPNSSSDECPTPPSTEDPTAIAQQPSISSHIHPQTNDATLKAKPISSITTSSTHMSDPSFAFAGPTVW
jgi:cytoskeletal protein RodZ